MPLSVKVIPAGRVGAVPIEIVGVGAPVVATVKLKGAPTMDVADAALKMVGGTASSSTRGVPLATLVQVESAPAYGET